mmetsp:Transcript_16748/g.28092  ORF Transcript_16748/g.28092 Transcript_16748/m.28092 type:complete len:89 (+) Transcript_16748:735-1001(+)
MSSSRPNAIYFINTLLVGAIGGIENSNISRESSDIKREGASGRGGNRQRQEGDRVEVQTKKEFKAHSWLSTTSDDLAHQRYCPNRRPK